MKKKEIIKDIIKNLNHQPVLFIGSGISKRYFNLENWEELLRKMISEVFDNELKYEEYLSKVKETDYYGKQASIGTLLEKDFNKIALKKQKFSEFREKNKDLIKQGVSPFKIRVSEYISSIDFSKPNLTNEVKLLKELSKRSITGIITTNYDNFLENIFDGYQIYSGQEELIFSNLQGIGEIYKIHGTASNPKSIILTSNDYKKFEEKSDYLIAKILTIFIEYPIIF